VGLLRGDYGGWFARGQTRGVLTGTSMPCRTRGPFRSRCLLQTMTGAFITGWQFLQNVQKNVPNDPSGISRRLDSPKQAMPARQFGNQSPTPPEDPPTAEALDAGASSEKEYPSAKAGGRPEDEFPESRR